MELPIKLLSHYDGLPYPAYQTEQSAGLDLAAAIEKPIILKPFERIAVPTGIAIQLPIGCEAQIRPRSGCSLRDGLVTILGTIDADYRGELKVIVQNVNRQDSFFKGLLGKKNNITITRGMRIAQLVITPYIHVQPTKVDELLETSRGEKGFGSTGK